MTPQQRADIANAIWLCQTCAKLIDNDQVRFDTTCLLDWKNLAERGALSRIGRTLASLGEAPQISDKWVSIAYPEKTGIAERLKAEGYELCWSSANDESERVDIQGWEPVLLNQPDGTRIRLKIRDHPVVGGYLVLLSKKRP